MTSGVVRVEPVPGELGEEFWNAARRAELVIQRCQACGTRQHPPFPVCANCGSLMLEFEAVSGRGHVVAKAVVHVPIVPGWESAIPFALVVIELLEDPGLLFPGNIVGSSPDEILIGDLVTVTFPEPDQVVQLPLFTRDAKDRNTGT